LPEKLPLYFEPDGIGFVHRGKEYAIRIDATSTTIALGKVTLDLKLIGAREDSVGEGADPQPGRSNYFLGNDPTKWRRSVPHYSRVRYAGIYSGIDLIYHEGNGELEFDFVVQPGASPQSIRIGVSGTERMQIEEEGHLLLETGDTQFRIQKPRIYQDKDGKRTEIAGGLERDPRDPNVVTFRVGRYDQSLPLVIDPQLVYSTYLGGSGTESSKAIGLDAAGNICVGGTTASLNFPIRNAYQPVQGGGSFDAFVTKFNADGSALIYSTYLGGNGAFDDIYGMWVDPDGNTYLVGSTTSSNFPTVNPIQATYAGNTDGWVAKLSPDGSQLLYSTYLGGSQADPLFDVVVDGGGNAYIAGRTVSTNYPTKDPIQPVHAGGYDDAVVLKINASGSALVWSTYLGGDGSDEARGIAINAAGEVYVTGDTRSAGFPTVNALQPVKSGDADAFVTKISADGQSILYSTFLGGEGTDESFGLKLIALDPAGNICVAGNTYSTDFPTVNPVQSGPSGESDAFVAKIKADGSALVYSTYLGSSAYDDAFSITVDRWGNAHVVGESLGSNFPILNAYQTTFGGTSDAVVVEIDPLGNLIYSTYLGGSNNERANDIVLDANGDPYFTGQVWSTNFPTVNPYQAHLKGPQDAFVAKFTEAHAPGEVASLSWAAGEKTTLLWSAAVAAETYDLYRGDGTDLPKLLDDEIDSCLALQTPNLDSGPVLTDVPAEGSFHWYLVRGENSIGLGLLGSGTLGPRILDPSGACP
jgi:hypothetical protein